MNRNQTWLISTLTVNQKLKYHTYSIRIQVYIILCFIIFPPWSPASDCFFSCGGGVVNYCKVSMLTVKIRLMGRLHGFLLCASRSFTSFAQFHVAHSSPSLRSQFVLRLMSGWFRKCPSVKNCIIWCNNTEIPKLWNT